MRSFFALLLCLALLAPPAHALDWAVGAQVVGSQHSLTGDLPDDGEWEGGFSFGGGIMLEVALSDDIALSFQPTWLPRQCVQRIEERGVVLDETDFDLTYLDLPLVVRVTSNPARVQGFVTAGLSLGYLLDATVESEGISEDFAEMLDDFTLGALFGAGAIVAVGRQHLIFEFRYEQGLDDIVDRNTSGTSETSSVPSVKYRELKLSLGVLFGAGGDR